MTGRRRDRVAETDIDLQRYDRFLQFGDERGPDAPVVVVLTNLLGLYRGCIKADPIVFDSCGDDLGDHGGDRVGR